MTTNENNIRALPIHNVGIMIPSNINQQITINKSNIQNESNIIIEPITVANDRGAEQAIAWKITATIYVINHDATGAFDTTLDALSAIQLVSGYFDLDSDQSFNQPDSRLVLDFNSEKLNLKYRTETTQGFYRHVIQLYGIHKTFPLRQFNQQ